MPTGPKRLVKHEIRVITLVSSQADAPPDSCNAFNYKALDDATY